MNAQNELDLLAEEILALETETFAISEYVDVAEAILASTSCSGTTSTTSATTSSTSCNSCTSCSG